MMSEPKLDDSFPDSQFLIEGFGNTFHLEWNRNGGGNMLFIRSDVPAKVISTDRNPFESFYVKLKFRKKKWLLNFAYSSNNNNMESHLICLSRSIDLLSSKYEKNFTWRFHSHKKWKDSLETRAVVTLIFSVELEISGVAVHSIHQNSVK